MEINFNQMATTTNHYQGSSKKVLSLCSAGLLRSPTAAHLLSSGPWYFNTRAAGTTLEYALVPISPALVYWADEIICMGEDQAIAAKKLIQSVFDRYGDVMLENKAIHTLNVPDRFSYMDPDLVEILKAKFHDLWPIEDV